MTDDAIITGIRPLPSDPSSRSILVNKRVVGHLREADVESLGLAVDQPWTEERAAAVDLAIRINATRKRALDCLARRALTADALRDRLVARDHEADAIDAVINELIHDGWLDDASFARDRAEALVNRRGAASAYIARHLEAKQVHPELAAQIADEAVADVDAVEAATELIFANHARWRTLPRSTQMRRAAGLLARRGYDEDVVREALRRCGLDPDAPSEEYDS
ncbi:MAG: regulatory protein RecX [Planctomycetota bacterium]